MPDPVLAPWGILFDPDGRKTDELLHGDGDQEVPDPTAGGGSNVNSHPEYGPWSDAKRAQIEARNMDAISAALARQDQLEALGARYNSGNGTWKLPDGRITTLSDSDPGPPGVNVTHEWGDNSAPEEDYGGGYGGYY